MDTTASNYFQSGSCIQDLTPQVWPERMLKLLLHQAESNSVYRDFLKSKGIEPSILKIWSDFPALPVRAFRNKIVTSFPSEKAKLRFETSGTTSGQPGLHFMENEKAYEGALEIGFASLMPQPIPRTWISLIPPWTVRPQSSLSYMVEHLAKSHSDQVEWLVGKDYRFGPEKLFALLSKNTTQPLLLLGTSIAWADFVEWLEEHQQRLVCPEASVIFDTGGFKKRPRIIAPEKLWKKLSTSLKVPMARIANEYGMTELSSPCYASAEDGIHRIPATVRVRIISPETGQECSEGERGFVHLYDLANVHGVAAIATEDIAIRVAGGFRLVGRFTEAVERGCSLPYQRGAHP